MAKATDRVYEGAEIMDSRDVIEKIEELEALEAEATTEEPDELTKLREMAKDGEGSPDWPHGETLILDSYFEQYAQDLAEDIGAVQKDATWPNQYIDWEAAADALKQDYMRVTYGETEYWIRA
jgi:antirestriction protein